jgi:hypothetical protein
LEEYVSQQLWLSATLPCCPIDGCRPWRHGYYWRKFPERLAIARFYCPRSKTSISLLPDFMSSRYRGELSEFEQVCVAAEHTDCLSVASAMRPVENAATLGERSSKRWIERRVVLFAIMLRALLGAAVEIAQGVNTASQLRTRLQSEAALVALRAIVAPNLRSLPPPLGFGPWPKASIRLLAEAPHTMAPEPSAPSG